MIDRSATERLLRRERWIVGGGLLLICVLCWAYLLAGSGTGMSIGAMTSWQFPPPAMDAAGGASWSAAWWIVMLLMWWIMMIAMMVPSAAPMILLYARVYRHAQEAEETSAVAPTATFAAGYLLAWLLFSFLATGLHFALEQSGFVHRMTMWSTTAALSGSFLVVAGLYQFSPWKNRCLHHCRSPVSFLSTHWRKSRAGALRMGLDHGLYCVGCCWSLMLLLFVGGVMNLVWIAALAAIVLLEKLHRSGRLVARGAGAMLTAAGVFLLVAGCAPSHDSPERKPDDAPARAPDAEVPGLPGAFAQIDAMLAGRRESQGIPGLAAGIVRGGDLAWAAGYGVMALDDPRPVTPETRFRIASLTKVFTATAVMKLRQAGHLALSDPARRHLEWFDVRRPAGAGDGLVTVGQLLMHTSGLPRDSRLTDFDRLHQPTRQDAIAALPAQSLQAPPGQRYAYSNLGYGVLGEVIAAASGISYAAFLDQEIFTPLGMVDTLVHPTPADDVAWGHGPRQADGSRPRAGFWELGFATPAGGMASSVVDLGKFMVLQLAPYAQTAPRLLSRASIREMHDVHYLLDPDRGGAGLGWAVEISEGQHLVYHGGELPEQTSFLLLDLLNRTGIVVLANAQDVDANSMAQEMLRIIRSALPDSPASFPAVAIPPA